jgi:hypothetical protein
VPEPLGEFPVGGRFGMGKSTERGSGAHPARIHVTYLTP